MTTFSYKNVLNSVQIKIKAENEQTAETVLKNILTETGISEIKKDQFILEKTG